jgi:hypothetical protein
MDSIVAIGIAGHSLHAGDEPLLLTVQAAARLLGIGRTLAYQETGKYLDSGGRKGIPAIRIGRCVRVPRAPLLVFAHADPVVALAELEARGIARPRPAARRRRVVVRRATPNTTGGVAPARRSVARPAARVRRPFGRPPAGSSEQQLRLLPAD